MPKGPQNEWHFDHPSDWGSTVKVYIRPTLQRDERNITVVRAVTFQTEQIEEGGWYPAAMELHIQEAQQILDSLWAAGLRPSKTGKFGAGAPPHVAALEDHLTTLKASHQALLQLATRDNAP